MEKIYLQSFDNYNELLDLFNYQIIQRGENKSQTKGWYKYIQNKLCYIYFKREEILLSFDNNIVTIKSDFLAQNYVINNCYFFELKANENLVLNFSYTVNGNRYLNDDIGGFIEDEDFDWGLFLVNLINNKKRQRVIVENMYP